MDKNQKALVTLLNMAIRNTKLSSVDFSDVDFDAVYNEAAAHQVHTLIYPSVKEFVSVQKIDRQLMSKWRKTALLFGIQQTENCEKIKHVFAAFLEAGIPVIALKGLVIRDLYPHPELRTMSDADILVQKNDLDKAKNILINMGFEVYDITHKHISFVHKSYPSIELHWSLITDKLGSLAASFENVLWQNSQHSPVCGFDSLIPSVDDHIFYLLLHMAGHYISNGFGLRQLCDIVLFTESHYDAIDWNLFKSRSIDYRVKNFVYSVFLVCHKLFNLKFPPIFDYNAQFNNEFIDIFIDDIFSGGVYGHKTAARSIGNALVKDSKGRHNNKFTGIAKYYLTLFFPPLRSLNDKYAYAKKYPVLIPIAWIHRLIYGIRRKDFSFSEKSSMLVSSPVISQQRAELLHWLDL